MIKSRRFVGIAVASALVFGSTAMTPAKAAQGPTPATVIPVVLWAVTGAVIGAVAWPYVAGGAAATAAAPGAAAATTGGLTSIGSFLNTGAAAGAVLGGVGYLMTR